MMYDPANSTKWFLVSCPGKKVPLRLQPHVQSEIIEYISSGEKIEVYIQTIAGFYQIAHDRVSIFVNFFVLNGFIILCSWLYRHCF